MMVSIFLVSRSCDWRRWALAVAVLMLGACASKPAPRAPVVDRSPPAKVATSPATVPAPLAPSSSAAPPAAAADNSAKPGYHTVKPGETLTRIAAQYGQDRRNIQAWNQLANPDLIEVGQVLRVVPPVGEAMAAPVATASPGARPLPPAGTPAAVSAPAPEAKPSPATPGALSGVTLAWPVQGEVITRFDDKVSRGIAIAGRMGDPVLAAADGVVAIAGSPIRGLGNLVIIQHAGGVITAYAHNQTLLVKEDQQVRQGQRIAEMGSSDSDRVKLHFEVRHQGKPVDPLAYLPRR